MSFLGPQLPLRRDFVRGYALIKDYQTLVKQNFKNLLLTAPGERMMNPKFGVGLRNFLFENDDPVLYDKVASAIRKQVNAYLPYLRILEISFNSNATNANIEPNRLNIRVKYRIVPLEVSDQVEITNTIN